MAFGKPSGPPQDGGVVGLLSWLASKVPGKSNFAPSLPPKGGAVPAKGSPVKDPAKDASKEADHGAYAKALVDVQKEKESKAKNVAKAQTTALTEKANHATEKAMSSDDPDAHKAAADAHREALQSHIANGTGGNVVASHMKQIQAHTEAAKPDEVEELDSKGMTPVIVAPVAGSNTAKWVNKKTSRNGGKTL